MLHQGAIPSERIIANALIEERWRKSRGSVLRARCRKAGYLHRRDKRVLPKSLARTVSGPTRKSEGVVADLHIHLHTSPVSQNNALYLLYFTSKLNALKIRRPQGRGGSSPPPGTRKYAGDQRGENLRAVRSGSKSAPPQEHPGHPRALCSIGEDKTGHA
jgi:hypothetical protein